METRKRTPLELFNLPQHFVIPLFQRPYVWEETDQWAPLWKDIRRTIEARITNPSAPRSHFLGAVVLQAADSIPGGLTTWNVIDGQQRLTTLQLLMDATHAALDARGLSTLASRLEGLTHNPSHFVPDGDSSLKVRHLNRDRQAFDEVMNADPGTDYDELELQDSRITRAHQYFRRMVDEWLGDETDPAHGMRAGELTEVLQGGLQLVSIDLTPAEDSQEIFETLNARGTPLTASDLIRNFVFQRLESEGADSKAVYERDWPFETKFWETDVSVGRQTVSRSSLFLNQWLISRTGEELSPHNTFSAFKTYVEHQADVTVTTLLPALRRQADMYEQWTEAAGRADGNLSPVAMAFYRMRASGIELLKPLLLWLTDPARGLDDSTIEAVISSAESWVYRRQLLRLTGSDLGRIVSDTIRIHSVTPPTELAERVTAHLSRLDVTSTYWPSDRELQLALTAESAYRRFPRGRLRMFLEAIEDAYRKETGQPQVQRGKLPIEHVMPQKWQDNWPVESVDAQADRLAHVHRLGNLTLLTSSLNSRVSNGPWTRKRVELLKHNTMTMTGRLINQTEDRTWDEGAIDERTDELVRALLSMWPVPAGHSGTVVDPQAKAGEWVEVKHLLEAGLLATGDQLVSTHRDFPGVHAEVLENGDLLVSGKSYSSPSAAGKALRQRNTNGWYFWGLADGRRLRDVRAQLNAGASQPGPAS